MRDIYLTRIKGKIKTHSIPYIIILICFFLSCSNSLNDAGKDGYWWLPFTHKQTKKGPGTTFNYLGYMYNADTGKQLNDLALTGTIFENPELKERIQQALNIKLRFALTPVPNSDGSPGKALSISPETPDEWWKTPWYGTLNSDIDAIVKQSGSDCTNDFTGALNIYMNMPDGRVLVRTLLNNADSNADAITSQTNAASPEVDTAIKSGIIQDADVAGLFTGSMSGQGIMNAASMAANLMSSNDQLSQDDGASGSLTDIQARLGTVQTNLDSIETKIDRIQNQLSALSNGSKYKDVAFARTYMQELYDHIQRVNKDAAHEYLTGQLLTDDTYGRVMSRAYAAATETQKFLINDNTINNQQQLQKHVVFYEKTVEDSCHGCDVNNTTIYFYLENNLSKLIQSGNDINFINTIPQKSWKCGTVACDELLNTNLFLKEFHLEDAPFVGMSLQDINLMKRMSLSRLQLLSGILDGGSLLKNRARFAQSDLDTLLIPVKKAINDANIGTERQLRILKESMNRFISSHAGDSDVSINRYCTYQGYNIITWAYKKSGEYSYSLQNGYLIYMPDIKSLCDTIPISDNLEFDKSDNNGPGVISRNTFSSAHADIYSRQKDYVVAAAAEIADWEIQLRAHIAAAQEL
jgi:hypothetical protein